MNCGVGTPEARSVSGGVALRRSSSEPRVNAPSTALSTLRLSYFSGRGCCWVRVLGDGGRVE